MSRVMNLKKDDTNDPKLSQEDNEEKDKPLVVIKCDKRAGCPIKLIPENLGRVFEHPVARDRPIVVFSIAGSFRTGKSFLLNFMIRFLKVKENNGNVADWLEETEGELTGFDWKQGADRVTEGVLLWSRPFVFRMESGKEVAVILMDTQGLFDDIDSPEATYTLVSLSTLLSSIQVFNVQGKIDESNLRYLELFAETGKMLFDEKEGKVLEKPFQRLVFLVRDWIGGRNHKYGEKGGQAYLQEKFRRSEERCKELKLVREHIIPCFDSIECFLMPYPGTKVCQPPDSDEEEPEEEFFKGSVQDMEQNFVKQLKKIAFFFFDDENIAIKRCGGKEVLGREMPSIFRNYTMMFADNQLPRPKTTRKALLEQYNRLVMDRIAANYAEKMKKIFPGDNKYMEDSEIQTQLLKIARVAYDQFDRQCRGNLLETTSVRDELQERIAAKEKTFIINNENIRSRIKRKFEKHCQKKLDEGKSMYKTSLERLMAWHSGDIVEVNLHEAHRTASKETLQTFLVWTDMCTGVREEYVSLLERYTTEEYQRYVVENDYRRQKQSRDNLVCVEAKHAALRSYQKDMDQKYMVQMEPTTTEEFEQYHEKCEKKSLDLFGERTNESAANPFAMEKELQESIHKEKKMYLQRNNLNIDLRKEREHSQSGRGLWVARCQYREIMDKVCAYGNKHMSEAELEEQIEQAHQMAEDTYLEYTNSCHERPKQWKQYISDMVNEESNDILNMNELNNPNRVLLNPF